MFQCRRIIAGLLALAGLAVTPAVAAAQDPATTISVAGVARSAAGTPAPALVQLHVFEPGSSKSKLEPIATQETDASGAFRFDVPAPPEAVAAAAADGAAQLLVLVKTDDAVVPRFTTWRPGGSLTEFSAFRAFQGTAAATEQVDVTVGRSAKNAMRRSPKKTAQTAQAYQCIQQPAGKTAALWTTVGEVWMHRDMHADYTFGSGARIEVQAGGDSGGAGWAKVKAKSSGMSTTKILGPNESRQLQAAIQYEKRVLACVGYVSEPYFVRGTWTGGLKKNRVLPTRAVCRSRNPANRADLGPGESHARVSSSTDTIRAGLKIQGVGLDVRSDYSEDMSTKWTAGKQRQTHMLCGEKDVPLPNAKKIYAGPNVRR